MALCLCARRDCLPELLVMCNGVRGAVLVRQAWGISVQGHPTVEYNTAYQKVVTKDVPSLAESGHPFPVFKSNGGEVWCYRHEAQDLWILRNKLTPDKPNCNACIVSKDGPLPLGTHTWKLSPTAVGKPKGTRHPNHSVLQA